ncbi:MAG: magnesium/cobalt transporter CorA [Armatimonadetes bacterium]|nr:magnesium/cobalt transporter CorA [Armatimonadota bacterium]
MDQVESHQCTWIDIAGEIPPEEQAKLQELFNLHPLALEDALAFDQRAKVEEFDSSLLMVVRLPESGENQVRHFDQLAMILTERALITVQQTEADCFDQIRKRLCAPGDRLRRKRLDALAHALVDAAIHSYFVAIEAIGDELEDLEDSILDQANRADRQNLFRLKRELLGMRRRAWPHREMLSSLSREELIFIDEATRTYFRDLNESMLHVIDLIETYREIAGGLADLYLSSVSQRMNEVMKVLTVTSTIFIPLSFVAGVYGMNFDTSVSRVNMPELKWPLGYPFALSIMAMIAFGLLFVFWRKGWLHND